MIYLDYNASTPVDPAVREAMLPFLGDQFGNPSSSHNKGRPLRQAIDHARQQLADLVGAAPEDIVFTASGTEANNHVIKGVADALRGRGHHIIVSSVEHPAVVNPCFYLEQRGFEITRVPVDSTGQVDPQSVIDEVRSDTILISIMHANNEVGTIQPIAEIADAAREAGIWMHTDAAQSCGKIDTDVQKLGVDFLSIAGHKLYAPQGVGALYLCRGIKMEPLLHGAGHESGRRAGTEATAMIVGLGKAAELAQRHLGDSRTRALRDRLHAGIARAFGEGAVLLGHPERRLPNTLAMGFRHRIGADILAACPDICASTGAACHAEQRKRSAVLDAMNVPEEIAYGAIRFSVGRFTTETEVDAAISQLARLIRQSG